MEESVQSQMPKQPASPPDCWETGASEQSPRSGGVRLNRLFTPVDIASLAYFRVAFGLLMMWEVWRYFSYGWIPRYYIDPIYHFTYFGFGWVQPWPGNGMYLHFAALGVLATLITVGLWYRFSMALFFLGFTYVFLLDQVQYLNHFYLISLFALVMIFVPANRAFSLDSLMNPSLRSDTTPFLAPALLAGLMGIGYFYGGLAKINGDWLQGEPMRMWLADRTDFPLIGQYFTDWWATYAFSYGGLLFDLLIVPFLIWRRTRLFAFIAAVSFHVTNAELFSIGVFPWFAIAATLMFFHPSWPRRAANWLRSFGRSTVERGREIATGTAPTRLGWRQWTVLAFVGVFLAVQLLFPLRHFLYPGNVSWTEEGHQFAWHMKLRSSGGEAMFHVTDPASGQTWTIDPEDHLTDRQASKMAPKPDMVLQFAHEVADEFQVRGYEQVEVRAEVWGVLNGREPQQKIDPDVNLAGQPRSPMPIPYILPLEEPLKAKATEAGR